MSHRWLVMLVDEEDHAQPVALWSDEAHAQDLADRLVAAGGNAWVVAVPVEPTAAVATLWDVWCNPSGTQAAGFPDPTRRPEYPAKTEELVWAVYANPLGPLYAQALLVTVRTPTIERAQEVARRAARAVVEAAAWGHDHLARHALGLPIEVPE